MKKKTKLVIFVIIVLLAMSQMKTEKPTQKHSIIKLIVSNGTETGKKRTLIDGVYYDNPMGKFQFQIQNNKVIPIQNLEFIAKTDVKEGGTPIDGSTFDSATLDFNTIAELGAGTSTVWYETEEFALDWYAQNHPGIISFAFNFEYDYLNEYGVNQPDNQVYSNPINIEILPGGEPWCNNVNYHFAYSERIEKDECSTNPEDLWYTYCDPIVFPDYPDRGDPRGLVENCEACAGKVAYGSGIACWDEFGNQAVGCNGAECIFADVNNPRPNLVGAYEFNENEFDETYAIKDTSGNKHHLESFSGPGSNLQFDFSPTGDHDGSGYNEFDTVCRTYNQCIGVTTEPYGLYGIYKPYIFFSGEWEDVMDLTEKGVPTLDDPYDFEGGFTISTWINPIHQMSNMVVDKYFHNKEIWEYYIEDGKYITNGITGWTGYSMYFDWCGPAANLLYENTISTPDIEGWREVEFYTNGRDLHIDEFGNPQWRMNVCGDVDDNYDEINDYGWIHYVMTWDGAWARLWINGEIVSSHAISDYTPNDRYITVGSRDGNLVFGGKMGSVQMYDGAMDRTQIRKLYAERLNCGLLDHGEVSLNHAYKRNTYCENGNMVEKCSEVQTADSGQIACWDDKGERATGCSGDTCVFTTPSLLGLVAHYNFNQEYITEPYDDTRNWQIIQDVSGHGYDFKRPLSLNNYSLDYRETEDSDGSGAFYWPAVCKTDTECTQFQPVAYTFNTEDISQFQLTSGFSIATWIKADGSNLGGKIFDTFVNLGVPDFPIRSGWSLQLYDCHPIFSIYRQETNRDFDSDLTSPIQICDEWTHLVGVWDGSKARLYVNGNLMSTLNIPKMTPNLNAITMPTRDGSAYFGGYIGDLRIYDGALSTSNVLDLYHER